MRAEPQDSAERRTRLLRREEFERMVEVDLFRGERIELIRGCLVERSPQNVAHAAAIQILTRLLMPALVGRADVRVQLPFVAGDDSLPEPDLAIVAAERFLSSHPDKAFLIIEVANTSLGFDRREKAEFYAQAEIPEYWVVNLVARIIERHSEPAAGAYTRVTPFGAGETIAPLAFGDVALKVNDVFGL
ncbi:MAG TPA: Uma2 family endonuclease [Polyangia bacterium]|nr:Uma2 family endonuclease [Polyangia bacterium]